MKFFMYIVAAEEQVKQLRNNFTLRIMPVVLHLENTQTCIVLWLGLR